MAARIARLTLFSGPQCSLCEVCIMQRPKTSSDQHQHPDCQGGASQGEATARVRPGSHQHSGERPGKVEEEIHLLDTYPPPQWEGDSQGPLGCLHSARGAETTGCRTGIGSIDGIITDPTDGFFIDTTSSTYHPTLYPRAWHSCLYDRIPDTALGQENDEPPFTDHNLRLCFNCGSPDHAVTSCPEPIDRQVVSLSRQLFHFLHPELVGQETTRVHVAEGWKQQRLGWLESFEPGVIRGPLLRDALGLQEEDQGDTVEWLRNMAYWGYPPGWVSCRDPRELVYSRILDSEEDQRVVTTEGGSFVIFEGDDEDEEVDLMMFSPRGPSAAVTSSFTTFAEVGRTRWATYPNTHFSSTALSIYNGAPLDRSTSVSPSQVSVTFTPERRALWDRILSGGSGTGHILPAPPWRICGGPGAMSHVVPENEFTPPPPSITPPPLPCAPKSPLRNSTVRSTPSPRPDDNFDITDDRSSIDMDMSDDE